MRSEQSEHHIHITLGKFAIRKTVGTWSQFCNYAVTFEGELLFLLVRCLLLDDHWNVSPPVTHGKTILAAEGEDGAP
jgi:hypothetical protein